MFEKILIANRGEIACRIIETARRRGIKTVAVFSEADANSRHVRMADEAYEIGPAEASESYLRGDKIISIALKSGAEAIHPGYGFLSENADFARECEKAELRFIGPSAESILLMGLKDQAKIEMINAGVPVVPGYDGEDQSEELLKSEAEKIGFPLLIKAVAGGGGKGMRLVENLDEFLSQLSSAKSEAMSSFGNDRVLLEKYIRKARHIEVQVFADMVGNAVYLHERDCSLQRRHQKVVEEAPAPDLSEDMRFEIGETAIRAAKAIKYRGAGTIEFIVDVEHGLKDAPFYFMEMNTRLQVEHPVTELITGLDLVEWQLRVAAGERLPLTQNDIPLKGHAFEVRLYAEDPSKGFLPQTGKLHHFSYPAVNGSFRVDTGIEEGDEVSIYYDPMIAKLIVWGESRSEAIRHMRRVLKNTAIAGVKTNLEFLYNIFNRKAFNVADFDTGFIDKYIVHLTPGDEHVSPSTLVLAALAELAPHAKGADVWDWSDGWQLNSHLKTNITYLENDSSYDILVTYLRDGYEMEVAGKRYQVKLLDRDGDDYLISLNGEKISGKVITEDRDFTVFSDGSVSYLHHYVPGVDGRDDEKADGTIVTPMPGKVAKMIAENGAEVQEGDPILILEAMKMEHTIKAPKTGILEFNSLQENMQVADGHVLLRIAESG
ncbi:acetyl/propionyl/methylcrotonyl-CoA carboxylase subunit alpha [Pseudemcibacter aquimaris]|uniref:acetyl/propionyl/methylcrotonyl-CoA carboxylase subunit alpha n=1 Tax=Pseudemcibacter aquimaris TaxID=2857064 RepID=UPI002011341F|nr:acetyl/propionyl/methylcrotonyl-CoA carboxylase subunit alpha [Pseudemcibacter aquimaris]MCC3860293.1 acetyl/propionyl/methylcrotonyl-CoA carboxylase subunit alpha [Pseudemcibacter aquimaris]WDU57617.1 acetyl/propionyl/methylcrotonyl-CoA carboxylase subunit alpha [Pseudemcibacter aquimaris]